MILTKTNITKWKKEFNRIYAIEIEADAEKDKLNISDCIGDGTDEDLLIKFEGMSVEQAVNQQLCEDYSYSQ